MFWNGDIYLALFMMPRSQSKPDQLEVDGCSLALSSGTQNSVFAPTAALCSLSSPVQSRSLVIQAVHSLLNPAS